MSVLCSQRIYTAQACHNIIPVPLERTCISPWSKKTFLAAKKQVRLSQPSQTLDNSWKTSYCIRETEPEERRQALQQGRRAFSRGKGEKKKKKIKQSLDEIYLRPEK